MVDKILVVDDDPTQRRLLQGILEKEGLSVHLTASGHEAIDYLASPESKSVRVMLLDLVMPEIGGIEVLEKIRPTHENLPVIVLTAKGGIETVVQAMQAGANDFVVKPASPQRLVVSIQNALQLSSLSGEVTRLKRQRAGVMKFQDLIAKSPATQQVVRLGERAAKSSIPILIEGESGVGKEIIARAIQGSSDRAGRPFVTVNCGAIPENLVESILFGHEKGAFTGASEKHQGKFKEADGGTLFLDEIGELRLDIQVKLLRALQENEIDPIGARRPVKVDIRLISATNRDLLEMVREGGFREDLYYRLNVFPINVPPLRERPDDIPDLIHFFIRRFASEEKKRVVGIEREAMALLQTYTWPGNVRQLENAVFRAVVLSDGAELGLRDFPQIAKTLGMSPPPLPPLASAPSANGANGVSAAGVEHVADEASFADPKPHPFANVPLEDDPSCAEITVTNPDGHLRTLEDVEGDLIKMAIDRYSGQMSEIARRLGIGRSTLYRKVRDLGIDVRNQPDINSDVGPSDAGSGLA